MGLGPSGGGSSSGSSDSNDDDDGRTDGDITEYGDSGGSKEDEDDSGGGAAAVAGATGAAASSAGGGAAGAAGVGGAGAAGGSGGSGSGSSGSENGEDEEAEDEKEGDDSESDDTECEEPEDGESEETEGDSDSDSFEDQENDQENDEEYDEDEEDTEEDEEEDEKEKEASIVVHTDPWDNTGWGMEPVLKHLQYTFGDRLEISYELAPVRTFDDPLHQAEKWRENAETHRIPTNEDVWKEEPPTSTKLSSRAFNAAKKQDEQLARNYLRRLRLAAQVKGRNIENRELLLDLAADVGLNKRRLAEDWDAVTLERTPEATEMPVMKVEIDNIPRTWKGRVEYERALAAFLGHTMEPEPVLQPLTKFVEEHGPVATEEVMEVFDLSRETATKKLRSSAEIRAVEFNCGTFWETV
ncbi:DsbA family protein [Halovivax asiaticus]|uniref:DsbA family protein n=1 Tax=Halovivax asiaticus TaxID=332953 RepID=UPI001266F9E6|nr:DsbA family protein [Halovivax asiaticus]